MTKIYLMDAATGEEVLRDMTDEEEAHHQAMKKEVSDMQSQAAKAESDKAALLAKLGISAEEAQLLIS